MSDLPNVELAPQFILAKPEMSFHNLTQRGRYLEFTRLREVLEAVFQKHQSHAAPQIKILEELSRTVNFAQGLINKPCLGDGIADPDGPVNQTGKATSTRERPAAEVQLRARKAPRTVHQQSVLSLSIPPDMQRPMSLRTDRMELLSRTGTVTVKPSLVGTSVSDPRTLKATGRPSKLSHDDQVQNTVAHLVQKREQQLQISPSTIVQGSQSWRVYKTGKISGTTAREVRVNGHGVVSPLPLSIGKLITQHHTFIGIKQYLSS